MTELRVHNFSISLDGFAAGPHQDADNPLGVGGEQLHEWIFPEGRERTAVDEAFVARGVDGIGATIMGRNMFGPVRGGWADSPTGPAGGATIRRSTTTSSSSPITRARRWRWPEAPPSTS